jgi:hypothetical protein
MFRAARYYAKSFPSSQVGSVLREPSDLPAEAFSAQPFIDWCRGSNGVQCRGKK